MLVRQEPDNLFSLGPPPVGAWVVSETVYVQVKKRPRWFHRLMVRLCFGVKWTDEPWPP